MSASYCSELKRRKFSRAASTWAWPTGSGPGQRRVRVHHRRLDAGGDRLAGEADLLVQQGRLAVGDVAVGQADAEDAGSEACVGERLPHRRAEAAGEDA